MNDHTCVCTHIYIHIKTASEGVRVCVLMGALFCMCTSIYSIEHRCMCVGALAGKLLFLVRCSISGPDGKIKQRVEEEHTHTNAHKQTHKSMSVLLQYLSAFSYACLLQLPHVWTLSTERRKGALLCFLSAPGY